MNITELKQNEVSAIAGGGAVREWTANAVEVFGVAATSLFAANMLLKPTGGGVVRVIGSTIGAEKLKLAFILGTSYYVCSFVGATVFGLVGAASNAIFGGGEEE